MTTSESNLVAPTSSADYVQISPHRVRLALLLVMCLGFVALGAWEFLHALSHLHEAKAIRGLWIGPLCCAVFLWFGWLGIRRFWSGYSTTVGPEGLTVPGPTFKSKLIPWDDIEAITSGKIRYNSYTGIRLKSDARLISQFSPDEAKTLLRRNSILGFATRFTAPMSLIQKDMDKIVQGSQSFTDLEAYYKGQRKAYGCEILLNAIDRDRDAPEFAIYLENLRQKYSTHTSAEGTGHPNA